MLSRLPHNDSWRIYPSSVFWRWPPWERADETRGGKRVDYPTKGSPAYGGKKPKQMCGGIAAFPCPGGKKYVDDLSDDCDPTRGGADCSGICVSTPPARVIAMSSGRTVGPIRGLNI